MRASSLWDPVVFMCCGGLGKGGVSLFHFTRVFKQAGGSFVKRGKGGKSAARFSSCLGVVMEMTPFPFRTTPKNKEKYAPKSAKRAKTE